MSDYRRRKSHMNALQKTALAAADASSAVRQHLKIRGKSIQVGKQRLAIRPEGRIYVVAIGKAAPAMASATSAILKEAVTEGIVTKPQFPASAGSARSYRMSKAFRSLLTEHPLPGPGSLDAGVTVAAMLAETEADDLVIFLVSGGASAMIELPLRGISIADLGIANQLLLASGAPINEINQVRSALSQLKAGGLARLAAPAKSVALILSDVVGDQLSAIGSGPTVLRRSDPKKAKQILQDYGIWGAVPTSIRLSLDKPTAKMPSAPRPLNVLIGTNRMVLEAAASQARKLGFRPKILTANMQGEARIAGWRLASSLRKAKPGSCLIMGGETTVRIRGDGIGGRNQELALGAATALEGVARFAVLALATDGIDGPTDAAGARIDAGSLKRAKKLGYHPDSALARNDSYPLLDAIHALIKIGPTGTNLNDIAIGIKYRA